MRAADSPEVLAMLVACPFLTDHIDLEEGPTMAMGTAAQLAKAGSLSEEQLDAVFAFWNRLAETADPDWLDILATGAIELFNDDATSQRLARRKLVGAALQILEDMRVGWGQPDYGPEPAQ